MLGTVRVEKNAVVRDCQVLFNVMPKKLVDPCTIMFIMQAIADKFQEGFQADLFDEIDKLPKLSKN